MSKNVVFEFRESRKSKMKFGNYKINVRNIGNELPLFFIVNYFFISLLINLFLGGNPKQSFTPILFLILIFFASYFFCNQNLQKISKNSIIILVDLVLLINIIILITGKVNSEGHLLGIFQEKLGINLKILLVFGAASLFLIKIYNRKKLSLNLSALFTTFFFLPLLLLIPKFFPTPFIDVFIILKQSIVDLFQNSDPYLRTYPDIYKGLYDYAYQKQEIKLVYWPTNLYFLYPFQIIFGDLRFAYPFFLLLSCLLLFILNEGKKIVFLISFILLFSNPYTFFMVKYGWIDTLSFPFFALYFLMFKKKKFTFAAIVLGILMSLKLYYIFLLPISFLYLFNNTKDLKRCLSLGFLSIFITILCFVPFIFTNFDAILYTISYFNNSLPRFDSLSVTGYIYQFGLNLNTMNSVLSIVIIIFILARIYRKNRTTILSQIQDSALILLVLFILGKQAFGNYYFNVMFLAVIYISILAAELKPAMKNSSKYILNEN